MATNCANCGFEGVEKFCPDCGQKKFSGRITVWNTLQSVFAGLFNLEHGLWSTIVSLTLRPGHSISEYVGGAIRRYFNPFKYILLAATIGTFSTYVIMPDVEIKDMLGQQVQENDDPEKAEFQRQLNDKVMSLVTEHYVLVSLAFVPVYGFFMWLFFLRKGRNFAESLVFVSFVQGHYLLFYALAGTLLYLAGVGLMELGGISMMLMLLLTIWASRDFYNTTWLGAIIRSGFATFMGFLIGIICMGLFVFMQIVSSGGAPGLNLE